MVNEEKVKMMTKLAIYESGKGKQDLKIAKFYKSDYVKFNVLQTMISATVCYWLVVALVLLMKFEYILDHIVEMDLVAIGTNVVKGYAIVLIVYVIIALIYYSIRYSKIKPDLIVYNNNLKQMNEYYKAGVNDAPKNVRMKGAIGENDEFINY